MGTLGKRGEEMTDDLYYRKLESISTSDLVDMLREKDRRIAELEKENAELKEKLDKIRNYLANDIPHELMNEATNKIWRMV